MVDNPRHIESLKTCCGVLAILSRDEANKLLIARDGIRLICAVMDQVGVSPDLGTAPPDHPTIHCTNAPSHHKITSLRHYLGTTAPGAERPAGGGVRSALVVGFQ